MTERVLIKSVDDGDYQIFGDRGSLVAVLRREMIDEDGKGIKLGRKQW